MHAIANVQLHGGSTALGKVTQSSVSYWGRPTPSSTHERAAERQRAPSARRRATDYSCRWWSGDERLCNVQAHRLPPPSHMPKSSTAMLRVASGLGPRRREPARAAERIRSHSASSCSQSATVAAMAVGLVTHTPKPAPSTKGTLPASCPGRKLESTRLADRACRRLRGRGVDVYIYLWDPLLQLTPHRLAGRPQT
jgi:hypothetical protein